MEPVDHETLTAILDGQTLLKDVIGMQDSQMESFYGIAFNFYVQRRFLEGENVFAMLSLCDHRQERFWLGLGACRQKLGAYEAAVLAYRIAMDLKKDDPRPAICAAECYLAMGLADQAIETLAQAISETENNDSKRLLAGRADLLRHGTDSQTLQETVSV